MRAPRLTTPRSARRSPPFHCSVVFYAADKLDVFGRVRHAIYGEAIVYDATHDDTGRRLPRQEMVTLASGQVRGTTHLLYDAIGRELKREDRDGATNPLTTNSYDALGQLRSSIGGSPAFRITADYDPLGNRVRLIDQVGPSQVSITPDTLDRDRICRIDYGGTPTGCNVTHDGSGNVVKQLARDGNTRALTYFPSGAVRTITTTPSKRSAVFRYDASGEISRLDVKGPTDSRNDHRYGLIQRRNAIVNGVSQSILVRQIPGVGASRRGANGPFVFPFSEQRGTRFTATNDSSAFVQDVSYRPFGEATSTPSTPHSPRGRPVGKQRASSIMSPVEPTSKRAMSAACPGVQRLLASDHGETQTMALQPIGNAAPVASLEGSTEQHQEPFTFLVGSQRSSIQETGLDLVEHSRGRQAGCTRHWQRARPPTRKVVSFVRGT